MFIRWSNHHFKLATDGDRHETIYNLDGVVKSLRVSNNHVLNTAHSVTVRQSVLFVQILSNSSTHDSVTATDLPSSSQCATV